MLLNHTARLDRKTTGGMSRLYLAAVRIELKTELKTTKLSTSASGATMCYESMHTKPGISSEHRISVNTCSVPKLLTATL